MPFSKTVASLETKDYGPVQVTLGWDGENVLSEVAYVGVGGGPSDTFDLGPLKSWQRSPKLGWDPRTGDELDSPADDEEAEILVALDYYLETGKANPRFLR